jgi:hypothetical protein
LNNLIREMKFLIILLITSVFADLRIRTFDQPGNYVLSPEDYGYASQIIVELWGAGGGGCSGNCGIGGGSGAYIKAKVYTLNQSFNITVGLGGKGGDGYVEYFYPPSYHPTIWGANSTFSGNDGEDTIFLSNDVNLIVGGGKKGNNTLAGYWNNNYGILKSLINNGEILEAKNGYDGDSCTYTNSYFPRCVTRNCLFSINAGNGGGLGGKGSISHTGNVYICHNGTSISTPINANGSRASGGGGTYNSYSMEADEYGSCQYYSNSYTYCINYQQAGYGGNGTVQITYDGINRSTPTISTSSTRFNYTVMSTLSPSISQISNIELILIVLSCIIVCVLLLMFLVILLYLVAR